MAKQVVSQEALRQALVNIGDLFVRKDGAKVLSTNDFTNAYKALLDNLTQYTLPPATASALGGIIVGAGLAVAADGTLSLGTLNISDIVGLADAIAAKAAASDVTALSSQVSALATTVDTKVAQSTLFDNGIIKSDLLPSFVDDVVEGYYDSTTGKFYAEAAKATELTGETGKIYLDLTSNCSYRFGGSAYALITSADIEMMTATNVNTVFNEVFGSNVGEQSGT